MEISQKHYVTHIVRNLHFKKVINSLTWPFHGNFGRFNYELFSKLYSSIILQIIKNCQTVHFVWYIKKTNQTRRRIGSFFSNEMRKDYTHYLFYKKKKKIANVFLFCSVLLCFVGSEVEWKTYSKQTNYITIITYMPLLLVVK